MTDLKKRLRQMEQLDAPDLWEDIERRRPASRPEAQESGLRRAGTIVLAFLVAGSALAFAVSRLGGEGTRRVGGEGTMTRYRFDAPPQAIAVGEGAAWVHVGAGDVGGTPGLWRIDAASGDQQPIDVPSGDWPGVGGGSAWLLCNAAACGGHAVLQIDPASGSVIRTIDLPGRGGQIAGVQGGVWITTEVGLSFVGNDGRVARSFPGQNGYNLVGSDGTSLWVARSGGLSKIDPETGERLAEVSFPDVCTMDVAEGTVWVASCDAGMHAGGATDELMGIDAVSGDVLFREPIPDNGQMRFLDSVLWLAERAVDGPIRIVGMDPRTGALTGSSVTVAKNPTRFRDLGLFGSHVFFAVGEGSLWVTDFGAGEVIRISGPFAQGTSKPVPGGGVTTPPSLSAGRGWQTISTGPLLDKESYPLTWATNATFDDRDLESVVDGAFTTSAMPYYSLPIDSGQILIVAGLINTGWSPPPDSPTFPLRDLPLDLHDADVQQEWEGHALASMCRYRLLSAVNGRYLELDVYFGGGCPNEDILAEAQAEVTTLIVPTYDPGTAPKRAVEQLAKEFLTARVAGSGAEQFLDRDAVPEFDYDGPHGLYDSIKGEAWGGYVRYSITSITGMEAPGFYEVQTSLWPERGPRLDQRLFIGPGTDELGADVPLLVVGTCPRSDGPYVCRSPISP